MRCQTPPVVSSSEYMEQIFGWKQGEDDLDGMENHYDDYKRMRPCDSVSKQWRAMRPEGS